MIGSTEENRLRQIVVGVCIIVTLAIVVCGTLLGWGYLPGVLGEWIGTMIGIMTTPFFLEGSFALIGLVIVISLNIWRRNREGDELVDLEELSERELAEKRLRAEKVDTASADR